MNHYKMPSSSPKAKVFSGPSRFTVKEHSKLRNWITKSRSNPSVRRTVKKLRFSVILALFTPYSVVSLQIDYKPPVSTCQHYG